MHTSIQEGKRQRGRKSVLVSKLYKVWNQFLLTRKEKKGFCHPHPSVCRERVFSLTNAFLFVFWLKVLLSALHKNQDLYCKRKRSWKWKIQFNLRAQTLIKDILNNEFPISHCLIFWKRKDKNDNRIMSTSLKLCVYIVNCYTQTCSAV